MITTVRLIAAIILLLGERYLSDPSMVALLCVTLISSYAYIDCCRARCERRIAVQAHREGKKSGVTATLDALTHHPPKQSDE